MYSFSSRLSSFQGLVVGLSPTLPPRTVFPAINSGTAKGKLKVWEVSQMLLLWYEHSNAGTNKERDAVLGN